MTALQDMVSYLDGAKSTYEIVHTDAGETKLHVEGYAGFGSDYTFDATGKLIRVETTLD